MTSIMFWNTGKNSVETEIGILCRDYEVDILIIAESNIPKSVILNSINNDPIYKYMEFTKQNQYIRVFSRFPINRINILADVARASIIQVKPIIGSDIIIVGVHLTSKRHYAIEDQKLQVVSLTRNLREQENIVGHQNSIIIGDMNMNPFEEPMVSADGFHAVMTKQIASKFSRVVQEEPRSYFYNPMWSFLGDDSKGPAGTFFRPASGVLNYFWNMFDQVLIRPSLIEFYKHENLTIITSIGSKNLLKRSRIDKSISDHLPILLKLTSAGDI